MKIDDFDDFIEMGSVELIEFLLKTEDISTFWMLTGMLCSKLDQGNLSEESRQLWMSAYKEPEEESAAEARQILRKLRAKLGKEAV